MANRVRETIILLIISVLVSLPNLGFAQSDTERKTVRAAGKSGMSKPQYLGIADWTVNDARIAAAQASHNKVAIVFWGGRRDVQAEGYLAAIDLIKRGIPAAFVAAPATHDNPDVAIVQIYARGAPDGTEGVHKPIDVNTLADNGKSIQRDAIFRAASIAYQKRFPERYKEASQ